MILFLVFSFAFGAQRKDVDQAIQYYQRGAYEKAFKAFHDIYYSESPSKNVFAAISLFMLVKSDFELTNYDKVIEDSREFERVFQNSRYYPDVLFERAKALAMKKQYYPSYLSAIKILSLTEDEKLLENVMSFCSDQVRYYLEVSDLELLAPLIVNEQFLTYHKLLCADKNIMYGDFSNAERLLDEVKSKLTTIAYIEKYKELNKYFNKSKTNVDPEINIAVVLPLTGSYSRSGQQLLEGIKYAFESYRDKSKKRVNIIIVDTESNVRVGLKNLKEILDMKNIIAVIGPLTSEMAVSMAPLCEYAGVPLITPTATADNLTEMGNSIFQLNAEQQQRGKVLANYATDNLKFRRIAVVAPSTSYGIDITDAFTKTVESNGAKIVYNVWYNGIPANINTKLEELKDNAEYLPPYFNYYKGYLEAKANGFFNADSNHQDSISITVFDSIFVDTLVFDSTFIDSLYMLSNVEDTTIQIDSSFVLEELWPDDPTSYEIVLSNYSYDETSGNQDSIFYSLKKHAKNWLSNELTIEERYNTIITDSICILLNEIEDPIQAEISLLLNEIDSVRIGPRYIGEFYLSKIISDTLALDPYINFILIDSLITQLAQMEAKKDSIGALWLLNEIDSTLFSHIFPYENYGIDAVYFPIPQDHIKYIAPQWARNRFSAFLLGDGNWYDESILKRYKSNIDSIVIASDYYWDSRDIELRRFSRGFTQKTNINPGRIHVYGYESMLLLMKVIESGGNTSEEISDKLRNFDESIGIIRKIEFLPERPRANSGVRLISFFNGKLRAIE